ncbi:MAG: diguanylate cyclase [Gemmatimonadales bacterium]|jgi:hypothetical protein|nr:MAG: diguanylate cyclase [Gemmatimonadales bacterium]
MADLTKTEDFEIVLEFAFGFADRGVPLSLVLIEPTDVPARPPALLEQLQQDILRRTRRSDRVTRLTDRRFAALLVDCNRQGAVVFADRVQQAVTDFVKASGCPVNCGVATFHREMRSSSDFLSAAANALARAHKAGGGTIELHGVESPEP